MISYKNFEEAANDILQLLHDRLGFGLWMVTRTESDNWIVLYSKDDKYDVKNGDVFRWSDSFCSRMVKGLGPKIAPQSDKISSYVSAPIASQVKIESYIGMPLIMSNGDLFGTLCAIDDVPHSDAIQEEEYLIQTLSKLLSTIIERDIEKENAERELQKTKLLNFSDHLTGVLNRKGWERIIEVEEKRSKRYGSPCAVAIIDLEGVNGKSEPISAYISDDIIVKSIDIINRLLNERHFASRTDDNELSILMTDSENKDSELFISDLKEKFSENDIPVSIGWAQYDPRQDYYAMIREATENLKKIEET